MHTEKNRKTKSKTAKVKKPSQSATRIIHMEQYLGPYPFPPPTKGPGSVPGAKPPADDQGGGGQMTWTPPEPLPDLPDAEPFPLHVLPFDLRTLVLEGAEALQCPPDYLASAALTFAGASIGSARAVEIKKGYLERPALYCALVGLPGTVKSPALLKMAGPILKAQTEAHKQYQLALKEHAKAKQADETVADPPRLTTHYVDNITCERLAEVLQENPRGVVQIVDELTALFGGLNQYKGGKGNDRQLYLSAWGGSAIHIQRKNREQLPVFVQDPFLAVIGPITSDEIHRHREDLAGGDGMGPRFLMCYPSTHFPGVENWKTIPEELLAMWADVVQQLRALPPEPAVLPLAPAAREAWEMLTAGLATDQKDPDQPPALLGTYSKLRAYGGRLALILQILHSAYGGTQADAVDEHSMVAAARMVNYFASHARKVCALQQRAPQVDEARRLLRWISDKEITTFSRRDAYTNGLHHRDAKQIDPVLNLLVEHGFIRPVQLVQEPTKEPHRPKGPQYHVNPLPWPPSCP
jgi:hypothetical protein